MPYKDKNVKNEYERKKYQEKKGKNCLFCSVRFTANRKYCSMNCAIQGSTVKNENGCWIWPLSKDKDGYGFIKLYKHYGLKEERKQLRVHRVSYEIFKGKISDNLYVCHKCDNPSCCNPDHLFLGSPKDNAHDSLSKNRNYIGEKNGSSKLKEKDINQIKKLYKIGWSQQKIADFFNVSQVLISKVIRKKIWPHVGDK